MMLLTLSVWAQHMITGQIIDAKTGEPIPFASAQYMGHGVCRSTRVSRAR